MTERMLRNANRLLLAIACLALALAAPIAPAQANATAKLPEFEVASVKPADPNGRMGAGLFTYPGRIVCTQCPLQYLLMEAFNVQVYQIAGGPGWLKDARFDIEAKPPATSESIQSNPASIKSPPNDEQRQMLQALLIDRFQLKFHREDREGAVYILEKGDKTLKLRVPKDKNEFPWAGGLNEHGVPSGLPDATGLSGRNISMSQLAARLRSFMRRPVLDQTGLQGSFDFDYQTGNDPDADLPAAIITSLNGIGLKLMPGKGPVETIVIDSTQKPSEN